MAAATANANAALRRGFLATACIRQATAGPLRLAAAPGLQV